MYIYTFFSDVPDCENSSAERKNTDNKFERGVFIYDIENKANPIGEICKKAATSQLSIADNYSVIFPKNANIEEKILLTITGVMIDYQYFENNTNTVK